MKMRESKQVEVFAAIYRPIMDLRMKVAEGNMLRETVDLELYSLEQRIWKGVHKALGLEGNP